MASANYAKVKAIQDNGTDFIYDADGYATFYDQSVLPKYGTKYEYVVVAYKDVFNLHGSAYLDNTSTIINDYVLSARAADLCSAEAYGFVVTDPGKPISLKTTANKSSIKVSWTAPVNSGVDGYYIYRYDTEIEDAVTGTIAVDAAHILAYVGSSETSYTDTAVADGKQYFYYISAYRKIGSDSFEGTASKVTGTLNVAKNIPQAIFATAADGKVDISWEGQTANDGYELSITKISSYNGSTTGVGTARIVDLTATAYTHTNLYNGDVYEYKARSYINVDGAKVYSAYSESVRATVGIALTTPQDLDAAASDGQVDISWSKVTGATGYTLYASKSGEAATEIDRTETKYSHKKLNNGQVWSYYVKAYKTVSGVKVYSPASLTVTATVGSSITIPQDLKAVSTDGQIDLSWTKVTGATGYILYASKNGGSSQEFDLSSNKFSHTGLTNGEKWTYYVKAYKDVNGVRVFSTASITVTSTAGIYLEAPKDLAATSTSGQITLTWTKVTGATGYKVYQVSGGSYTEVADVSKSTYTITGLTDGAYYSYTVAGYKIVNSEKAYGDMAKPVSIKCGEYLSAPTDVEVKPGDCELTVSWKKVTGAEGYVLYLYKSPLMVAVVTRSNPYPLVFQCLRESGITAFFTRSSAANIPVNLDLAKRLGVPESTASVAIPLGATINMAGASVTITVLTLAAVNTLGLNVDFTTMMILSVLATVSACGASGVAGGSLLLIPVACGLFGISSDISMQVVAIGMVISVLQDSTETALNSSTDVLFTAAVDRASK